ncbi:MAG: ATP-dependent DNA helicase RecG [Acidobacteriota bacterium]|nr:ATP-dependent DNA helicase RecG [Acidobacteriota bacterium]
MDDMPLVELKLQGLGSKSKEKLIAAGIDTVGDLLGFLPREYLDYSRIVPISEAPLERHVHVRGLVIDKKVSKTFKKKMPLMEILVDDGGGTLRMMWFNQPFLHKSIDKGQTVSFFGKIKFERLGRTMVSPKFKIITEGEEIRGIKPVYRQVGGLRTEQIAGWILALIESLPEEDPLAHIAVGHHFPSRREALKTLHQPLDAGTVAAIRGNTSPARRRLVLEEFLAFQKKMQRMVKAGQERNHPVVEPQWAWLDDFTGALPFQLTGDQGEVLETLMNTLLKGGRLHAMIQGDVGCGKTIIGLAAALIFSRAGYQSALLCPTQILAEQHYRTAEELLAPLGLKVAMLTGSMPTQEVNTALARLASGEIDLAVGTHRLLSDDIGFARLGLALIDEQHRFGVEQRGALLKKGNTPHYLAFSATPIPRSLAMTLYGDYSVLQIKQKPGGRVPVRTILKKVDNRDEVIRFARQRLDMKESVFWVFPLVEGDEEAQERSATAMYERFRDEDFRGYGVGLVHGRMKKEEVAAEMEAFRAGRIRVLVATTVIEVGVDVPDASIMVVERANRFGLSQLHQLRGRVGRGNRHAFCFLMIPGDIDRDGLKRMRLLEKSDDGFEIAAFDLEQRGAGELLGKRQSGLTAFRFGDPWLDRDLMQEARKLAGDLSQC